MRSVATAVGGALLALTMQANAAAPAVCPAGIEAADQPIFGDGREGCNALDSYYGELRKARPDWPRVRRCAVQSRDDAVLMMLYANGYGVPRDLDRAIVHACRFDGAPAEYSPRVEQLQKMKAGADRGPFDLCDHVTSGMMTGLCAGIAEEADSVKRNDGLARLARTFTPAQRTLFVALRKANDAFAEDVGNSETDLSGTGHVALSIEAQAQVRDALLADLHAAESGKVPSATAAAFAAADRALNDVYRRVMARPEQERGFASSTVTKAGIRATQRAWIAYRDAWTAFAQARYPAVPAAAWKTRLTERRTATLRKWLE